MKKGEAMKWFFSMREYYIIQLLFSVYRYLRKKYWMIRGFYRLFKIRERDEIWLELGGGNRAGSGKWVNIDMCEKCDIYYNLAKGIPFKNNSVAKIYSSHFFEHLAPDEASCCMKECIRVLTSGGEFSIAVPDARYYIDAYINQTPEFRGMKVSSWIDYARYVAYCDGVHKNMFDQDSLSDFLTQAGLTRVKPRGFDSATDLEVRRDETICAIGYKPEMS